MTSSVKSFTTKKKPNVIRMFKNSKRYKNYNLIVLLDFVFLIGTIKLILWQKWWWIRNVFMVNSKCGSDIDLDVCGIWCQLANCVTKTQFILPIFALNLVGNVVWFLSNVQKGSQMSSNVGLSRFKALKWSFFSGVVKNYQKTWWWRNSFQ